MNNGKSKIDNTLGRLSISIPSKKNWFFLIFGIAWMGGWYYGFISAFSTLTQRSNGNFGVDGFMTFWLLGWTIGGVSIIFLLLWGFFGKEKLSIENSLIIFEKSIFGFGIKKQLNIDDVKNFRFEKINENIFGGSRWAVWGLGPGKVRFDYGLKTYSFGLGVDDAEANYIVDLLKGRIDKD